MRLQLRSLLCAVVLLLWLAPAPALAKADGQRANDADWTGPLISGPVSAIFTPASGALLVRTKTGLSQSDDGGQTFHTLPMPPDSRPGDRFASVDPLDQNVLYASGDNPLYRSTDNGATWIPILTSANYPGFEVAGFTASPADSSLLYVALVQGPTRDSYLLLGSHDRGMTWNTLDSGGPVSLCGWGVHLLKAHPTDAIQVFLSSGCFAGRNFGASLQRSDTAGKTFQDWWKSDVSGLQAGYPSRLVGGLGSTPERWYLAVNRDARIGGSLVLRTDDDGATWTQILAYDGGGVFGPAGTDPNAWNIQVAGIAFAPSAPDTLYVARTAFNSADQSVRTSGVATSSDAGANWSDLGSQQLGQVADLALGVDGQNLYLASDEGLFRLGL
jgi:photosystem II stability/assembly factor-like uncharacterized protein